MTAPAAEVEGNQVTLQQVLMDTGAVSEGICPHNGNIASSAPCSAAEFRASPTHTGPGEPDGSLLYQCAGDGKCVHVFLILMIRNSSVGRVFD